MPTFLSTEWIDALDHAASTDADMAGRTAGMDLVVQQEITGVDGGPVNYHMTFRDGSVSVTAGIHPSPTVRFSQDVVAAVEIASGATSAQRAFMTGRLRVGGDLSVLLAHGEALAELGDVFGGVRSFPGSTEGSGA